VAEHVLVPLQWSTETIASRDKNQESAKILRPAVRRLLGMEFDKFMDMFKSRSREDSSGEMASDGKLSWWLVHRMNIFSACHPVMVTSASNSHAPGDR